MTAPNLNFNLQDASVIPQPLPFGIIALQGETLRGEAGKPVLVRSTTEFIRKLGGNHPDSVFPQLCMRLLDAGISGIWVTRAHHYTDVNDKNTAEGTKATITLTDAPNSAVFTAKGVGPGYNGIVINVTAAQSGNANQVDIGVVIPGQDEVFVRDIPENPTGADLVGLNNQLADIEVGTITNLIPIGSATLAGGVQTIADIIDTDYVGSSVGETGWHSLNNVDDATRIANIHRPDPDIDIGLAQYCEQRLAAGFPIAFYIGVPAGSNGDGWQDYRLGTGAFSHTAIDSWLGVLVGGHLEVKDPRAAGAEYLVSGAADVLPLLAETEGTIGRWRSSAGYKRGRVKSPSLGLEYNIGSPANIGVFNTVYPDGINAIVKENNRVMYWGNRTLTLNKTSILSKANVAEYVIDAINTLRPLILTELFEPNDPITWLQIYNNVRTTIKERYADGRAIRPIEDQDWFWIGDQYVTDYREAKFNELSDLDNGIYKVRFISVPIAAIEQIAIDFTVTDSNSLDVQVNLATT